MILMLIVSLLTAILIASAALHERDQANARASKYELVQNASFAHQQIVVNVRIVGATRAHLRAKAAVVFIRLAVWIGNFGGAVVTS